MSSPKVSNSKRTTIDQLDLENHLRYARDVEALDPNYLKDSAFAVPFEEEIAFPPQVQHLFEYKEEYLPWAHFAPPPESRARRRLFKEGGFLFEQVHQAHSDQESEQKRHGDKEQEQPQEPVSEEGEVAPKGKKLEVLDGPLKAFFANKIREKLALPEEERERIAAMVVAADLINLLIQQIHSKRLHFQKG